MREGIKTSLISILCAATATFAHAAPAVRTMGGAGTYDSAASAANATATNRAGSLRATGGYVRPSGTSTSGATQKATTASAPTTSGATATATTSGATQKTTSSVATGGGTAGRVASTPRLSIGKYVGAPKSISTTNNSVSDLTQRVDKLETDVITLQTDKQDVLTDTTYITVQGNELILEIEKIKSDLDLKDGREVEMGTNDEGLLWRYVGEEEWNTLISWDDLRSHLNLNEINTQINTQVTNLKEILTADIEGKVDKDQGTAAAGHALVVGDDGMVAATGVFATPDDVAKKLDKRVEDVSARGKALVVDNEGNIVPTGEFATTSNTYNKNEIYNKSQIDEIVTNITNKDGVTEEELNAALKTKVDIHQSDPNAIGMALVVNRAGDVEATGEFVTEQDITNILDNYELDDLGDLAYMDAVGTAQINNNAVTTDKVKDKAITEEKLADGITNTLGQIQKWEDWWNENKPGEGDYVMSVQADGTRNWFRVVGADE